MGCLWPTRPRLVVLAVYPAAREWCLLAQVAPGVVASRKWWRRAASLAQVVSVCPASAVLARVGPVAAWLVVWQAAAGWPVQAQVAQAMAVWARALVPRLATAA